MHPNPRAQPTVVTIYTSPTCVYCHAAKEYFKDHDISYTERDITTDNEALEFIINKVGQAVTPIITVDDQVVVGFDRPKLDEIFAASGAGS